MNRLLFVLTQKLAVAFVMSLGALGGFLALGSGGTAGPVNSVATSSFQNLPPQTAIISDASILSKIDMPPGITPGLLPTTTVPFCNASSTCGIKAIKALTASLRLTAKTATSQVVQVKKTIALAPPPPQPHPQPTLPAAHRFDTSFLGKHYDKI
jgi:hypothetical protein